MNNRFRLRASVDVVQRGSGIHQANISTTEADGLLISYRKTQGPMPSKTVVALMQSLGRASDCPDFDRPRAWTLAEVPSSSIWMKLGFLHGKQRLR
jgi:hypothetical protein